MRRTKIVCTIGPASCEPEVLIKLIKAGMNVARLNLSHGEYHEHNKAIENIRKITHSLPIIADLQGPRIRTGLLQNKKAKLKKGGIVFLTAENILGNDRLIPFSPARVLRDMRKGQTVLLADGTIKLKVLAKRKRRVECLVLQDGILGEHKGVNLPQTQLHLPSLTTKDKKDIAWAVKQGIDYIAFSFVRNAEDVMALKKILKEKRANIPIITKIEKIEALQNLKEIIKVSDAIMVARGDLGVEISLEKVPVIQKEIIEMCQIYEKPVIVATQMLESMVKEPVPTRAEVSDVANAIFDGTDAVMLSEETSIGNYPVETVHTMARIAEEADRKAGFPLPAVQGATRLSVAVAHAACILVKVVKARAIITFTETGSTALRVSKHRPSVPIYGVVTNNKTLRRLALYYDVRPIKINAFHYIDEMILNTEKALSTNGYLKKGDLVVITAGVPINIPGTTNLIKVHRIGERRTL
jgi:pyruvate kinase